MGLYDILYTGLSANKQWLEVSANNITNINTTRTKEGTPYKRQSVVFESKDSFNDLYGKKIGGGVEISEVRQDAKFNPVYDPNHPDADAEGIVKMPAISLPAEMTNVIMAQRAYEAGVTTLNAMKEANNKTYEIGKV